MNRIYENYERNYLSAIFEDLLPTLVEMKQINGVIIPTISIESINNLGLTKDENNFIIEFLKDNEILVIDDICDDNSYQIDFDAKEDSIENYKIYRLYKKETLPKLLKKREINEKFVKLKNSKDLQIREEIILGTMHLVTYYAWFYSKIFMMELEEIEQYGYEGLINAVDHFNLAKEKDFYIYAGACIKGYIKRRIRGSLNGAIPINLCASIFVAKSKIEKEAGLKLEEDDSLVEKLVDLMIEWKIVNDKFRLYYIQAINLIYKNESIEKILENGEDIYSNKHTDDDLNLERERFLSLLKKLKSRQQEIIKLHYGFDGNDIHTFDEISKMKNLSREGVRYYEVSAMDKIMQTSISVRFKEMLDDGTFCDIPNDDYMESHQLVKK